MPGVNTRVKGLSSLRTFQSLAAKTLNPEADLAPSEEPR